MARLMRPAVLLLACVGLAGCFRPSPTGTERALHLWRTRQVPPASNPTSEESGVLVLDAARAVELALRQGPALREARARVEAARGEGEEDTQLDNPEIRIRDVEMDRLADGEPVLDVGLRVPIPRPWTLHARKQRAGLRLEAAQARRTDLERTVSGAVRKLFARLAMLERDRSQTERARALAARHAGNAAERVKRGELTRSDAAFLLLRHAEILDRQHALQLERAETVATLRRLTGLAPNRRVRLRTAPSDLEPSVVEADPAALVEQALQARRDLRAAAARVEVARADAYIARARRWPWMRFAEVSYNVRPAPSPRAFEVALAVELPLLSLNGGAIAEREATLTRRQHAEQDLVLAVAQQVQDAARREQLTAARLQQMKTGLLPALETTSDAANEALTHGLTDARRAMAAEWRRMKAQRRYLEALLAHREAAIDLEAAVGRPLPPSPRRKP